MKTISPILLALLIVSCAESVKQSKKVVNLQVGTDQQQTSCIQPFQGLEIEPTHVQVSANESQHVELATGSSFDIPANAFVDGNGKPIQGIVDIAWNEYHSLTDILFSGIPMKYDSAGVQNDLVSGGMFTIKGSQNGEEVHIAPGKDIQVNINSSNGQSQFNFYSLNESSGQWDYMTTKRGETIPEAQLKENQNKKGQDYNYLHLNLDMSKVPEVNADELVCWKTKRKLLTKEETRLKSNPKGIYLDHNEDGEITINYDISIDEKFTCEVKPHYIKDARDEQDNIEDKISGQLESILAFNRDMKAGKVTRSISIAGFGTYNWDCIHNWSDVQEVFASYKFPDQVLPEQISVFYICPEDRLIINTSSSGGIIKFNPQQSARLVAILPGNKLCIAGQEEFGVLSSNKSKNAVFEFNDLGVTLKDPSDINDYLHLF